MPKKLPAILADDILSDRLKTLWTTAGTARTKDDCYARQQAWIGDYADVWAGALRLPGEANLKDSLCRELAELTGIPDLAEVERRCRGAMIQMKKDWENHVRQGEAETVVEYYDTSESYAFELMWWHTLEEDNSPLAYVSALHLALQNKCRNLLDFGSGVGSGALLFESYGLTVSLADISSTLLDFARRRLDRRGVPANFLDLKSQSLPAGAYDFITAMDVFEHIAEPEETVDALDHALLPGGILFGRFSAETSEDRPSHIARDFAPTFRRLEERGYRECWKDEWLWGHQAFQKPA